MGGAYLVGVAFWMFVGACAVTAIITDHKKRRLGVDLLRAAIDKGQPLDPALVEKVFARDERRDEHERVDPLHLKLGGIITTACGVGLMPLAYFLSRVAAGALYPVVGAGFLVICVGLGLLISANVLAGARTRELAANARP